MAFKMVDRNQRLVGGVGECLGSDEAYHDPADQPWPGGCCDRIDVGKSKPCVCQRCLDERHYDLDVRACRDFGDDAAERGVFTFLPRQSVRQYLPVAANHGSGGFVAAGLDAQDDGAQNCRGVARHARCASTSGDMTASSPKIRLGTRGSPLALAQAHMTRAALIAAHGWAADEVEIVAITTDGDVIQDRPLAEIGGKALWTKTLDRALMEGRTDASVHSMKDVETIRPEGIALVAMLERADVRDRLIGAVSVAALPEGAVVGTASPRRAAQLRRLRPDLKIVSFRGNVATRIARVENGEAHATMLAAAGLDRLGHPDVGVPLDIEAMLPAVAQGAVGLECRAHDAETRRFLTAIDDTKTHRCVAAERAFLAALGGGCHSPVGVLARLEDDVVHLRAEILTEDGTQHRRGEVRFVPTDKDAPRRLATELLVGASPALAALFSCES